MVRGESCIIQYCGHIFSPYDLYVAYSDIHSLWVSFLWSSNCIAFLIKMGFVIILLIEV